MKVFLVGDGDNGLRSKSEVKLGVRVGVDLSLVGEKEPSTPVPMGEEGELQRPITTS
jgi:hypothetical protein